MSEEKLPVAIDLSARVTLTVPFHDADPAGIAWHGNYFRYFDGARCALLDKIGYSYRQMLAGGYYWPIVQATVKYIKPVNFDAQINVIASLVEWEYRLKIAYEVFDDQKNRTTTGETVQVAVNATTGEMHFGAPEDLRERLRAYLRRSGPGP